MKHCCDGEGVFKRCAHLRYQMSNNFTVKWLWIFLACIQESALHGFVNSSFNYYCFDSSFQQSVFKLTSM